MAQIVPPTLFTKMWIRAPTRRHDAHALGVVFEVGGEGDSVPASGSDLGSYLVHQLGAVHQDGVAALRRHAHRDGAADTLGGTGDDAGLARETARMDHRCVSPNAVTAPLGENFS